MNEFENLISISNATTEPLASANDFLYQKYLHMKSNNRRLSIRWLAKRIGLSHTYVIRLFSGKKKVTHNCLHKFADVFDLTPIEIEKLKYLINTQPESNQIFQLQYTLNHSDKIPEALNLIAVALVKNKSVLESGLNAIKLTLKFEIKPKN